MAKAYKIGEKTLTISAITEIIASSTPLTLSQKSKQKMPGVPPMSIETFLLLKFRQSTGIPKQ